MPSPPKHTPGPWEVRGDWYIGRKGRLSLAEVKCGDAPASDEETHKANARLIAAAPDLLMACKTMKAALERYSAQMDDLFGHDERFGAAQEIMEAAITKAEGGTDASPP